MLSAWSASRLILILVLAMPRVYYVYYRFSSSFSVADRLGPAGPARRLRQAVILVGGDKAGKWSGWYRTAVPMAEQACAEHLKRMQDEGTGGEEKA